MHLNPRKTCLTWSSLHVPSPCSLHMYLRVLRAFAIWAYSWPKHYSDLPFNARRCQPCPCVAPWCEPRQPLKSVTHLSGRFLLGLYSPDHFRAGKKDSAGAEGSSKQGLALSAGSWVSDKLHEASPSLSNSFSEATCEAKKSPERSCPINMIHIFHSTHTHTPVSNCSGEEVPGDIRIHNKLIIFF